MKQRHFKALTSLLLVVVMLASMLPAIPVFAADETLSLSFANKAQRTSFSSSAQVWEQNGVKFTNNKASSSNAVADYANPVRLYAGSNIIVEAPGKNISKIVFTAGSSSYATALKNSIGTVSGATVTASGSAVTVAFTTPVASFTIAKLSAQVRLKSMTVTAAAACDHSTQVAIGEAKAATCTEDGITAGSKCANCGEVSAKQEVIPATGHTDTNPEDNKCDTCGTNLCTNHVWVDGEVEVEGNCTTDRVIAQVCENCGEPGEDKVIAAPGHNSEGSIEHKDATCTEAGVVGGTYCTACNDGKAAAEAAIPTIAHNYVDGVCACGAEQPSELTISFASTAQRTEYSSSKQVWSNGGLVFTNNKSSSTTNVGDYSNPVRLYKSSQVVITGPAKIIKAVFVTPSGEYSSPIKASLEEAGYTVSANGTTYTVTFAEAVENITFTLIGQGRINTLTVEFEKSCSHSETVAIGEAKDATCTEDGITAGSKCAKCGEILVPQETITAPGHTDANGDYVCDVEDCKENLCENHVWVDGEVKTEGNCTVDKVIAQVCENCGQPGEDRTETAPGHTPVTDKAVAPDCTTAGKTEGSHCNVCGATIVAQQDVPATGHTMVDGVCSECGYEAPINVGDKIYFTAVGKYLTGISTTSTTYGLYSADASEALVFTIEEGSTAGTYAFKCGDKYLNWPSGKNSIKLGDKTDWVVEVDENGVFTISVNDPSQPAYGIFSFNTNSGQERFATYKTSTVTGSPSKYPKVQIEKVPTAAPAPEAPEYKGFNVTLNGGITINVTYDISAEWIEAHPEAKVAFVFADGVELSGSEPVAPTAGTTKYSFTLTPQAIEKQLYIVITEGETEIERYEVSYSIYKENVEDLSGYEGLSDLLDSIDSFTAAANGTLTEDVTADFTDVEAWTPATSGSILKSVNISLGQQITAKIGVDTTIDYTGYKVTVTLGEVALLTKADFTQYITSEGKLVVKGLAPTHLNDQLTVTVYDVNGNEVASTSFNINSYLKTLYETTTGYDKNLAAATFNYGVATEAYAAKNQ